MIKVLATLKGYVADHKHQEDLKEIEKEKQRKKSLAEMNARIEKASLAILKSVEYQAKMGETSYTLELQDDAFLEKNIPLNFVADWLKNNTDLNIDYMTKTHEWNEYGDKMTYNTLKITW